MTSIWQFLCWTLGLTSVTAICKKRQTAQALALGIGGISIVLWGKQTVAQLTPDTLGDRNLQTTVTQSPLNPQFNLIQGGKRPQNGANLFHSFSEFNVLQGQFVYFEQPDAQVKNILSRVTGNNPSNILGTLGVLGNANLFLINPNGIIFGPNATLDVGGSFVATTANAILLGDTGRFSASEPASSNLLTIQPSAFFFNRLPTQPIVNRSRAVGFSSNTNQLTLGLQVPNGRSLLLVGGDVRLEGGILQAPGGRVELAGVAGTGNVALNANGNTLSLNLPNSVALSDVSLTNRAIANVAAAGGGSIAINARNLELLGGSNLSAGIGFGGTADTQAGDITLNATNIITIADRSSVFNTVFDLGNAGNVRINTGQLLLRDGVVGISTASPQSRAGTLTVNASDLVEVTGTTTDGTVSIYTPFSPDPIPNIPIGLLTAPIGDGSNAEALRITTRQLTVQGGARLSVGTASQRRGGNLTIQASDLVEVIGTSANGTPTLIASGTQGSGASGDVTIDTRRLVVRDGAIVTTGTSREGQGGKLTVRASESVELRGTATTTLTDSSLQGLIGASLSPFIGVRPLPSGLIAATVGTGNSGDLTIETGRLVIQGGAQASTSTGNSGKGGELRVVAPEIELSGLSADGFFSSSLAIDSRGAGDAGNLSITTRQMTLRDGGQVLASTSSTGRAGTLDVNASDSVQVIGTAANGKPSSLFFDTSGSGNAGTLRINTGRLIVQNGGRVSAGTTGTGQGGTLNVNATDLVDVTGTSADGQTPSRLLFDTSSAGDAGELRITTPVLRVRDGGQVSARTSGTGRGGVLQVTAPIGVEVSGTSSNGQLHSGLYFDTSSPANARGIRIDTGSLVVQDGGQVTVSGTGSGAAGDLEVNAGSIVLNNQGKLSATTTSGEGGNIRLQVGDSIVMRHNSEISTEASGTGNGGNINIDTGGFVLALLSENSDVVANAFQGRGGNILARAQGIYGFRRFEKRRTPESDFTASSQLGIDGVVDIDVRNEPQPIPLAEKVVTAEITQACQESRGQKQNEFIITGRGGLPDNPSGVLSHDAVWTDLRNPTVVSRIQGEEPITRSPSAPPTGRSQTTQPPIVEANGWVINDRGEVVLTASAPNVTPHSPTLTPRECHVP